MSSAACSRIAATTCGWLWPVELTAIPAAKSRKRLPSMSSTTRPSPRTGTIGYARGRLGDVQVLSYTTWALALGPGISVTRCGTGRVPARRDRTWVTGLLSERGPEGDGCRTGAYVLCRLDTRRV